MRLFEAILEANARAGDARQTQLNLDAHADALPVAALTCIDARLNHLVPEVLGIPEEKFVWLRNAGNIITGPLSSTMRSLALACAIKGAREIVVVGHTDCLVGKATMMKLTDTLRSLGIDRQKLPENLTEYFGLFASERQNVMRGADVVRASPLIGPNVPVHGLLVDLQNGRLEWLVNGYQNLGRASLSYPEALKQTATDTLKQATGEALDVLSAKLADFKAGEMKFPELKIGEVSIDPNKWLGAADKPVKSPTAFESQWLSQVQPAGAGTPETAAQPREERRLETTAQSPAEFERLFDKAQKYKVIGSDQKVYGPISGMKILEWIAEGRINWQTPAQMGANEEWKPLALWVRAAQRLGIPLPPPLKHFGRGPKDRRG
jgi:carbonic anhydrase